MNEIIELEDRFRNAERRKPVFPYMQANDIDKIKPGQIIKITNDEGLSFLLPIREWIVTCDHHNGRAMGVTLHGELMPLPAVSEAKRTPVQPAI